MIKDNPYLLAQEVRGFTFSQSDILAQKLGVSPTASKRIVAGVRHALLVAAVRNGHCVLPLPQLLIDCEKLLNLPQFTIYEILLQELSSPEASLIRMAQSQCVHNHNINSSSFFLGEEDLSSIISKKEVYEQELGIAADIHRIQNSSESHPLSEIIENESIDEILSDISDGLSQSQRKVLEYALKEKVLIVTGGPGVGKTATVTRILKLFEKYNLSTLLCAPTGRAAVRLQELSGTQASTVHRLLECSSGFSFLRNRENRLDCKLLIVDEFSMMDMALTHALFQAIPSDAMLVIVGDPDQLPSVGPGNVLKVIFLNYQNI